jgi:hypothetical protein
MPCFVILAFSFLCHLVWFEDSKIFLPHIPFEPKVEEVYSRDSECLQRLLNIRDVVTENVKELRALIFETDGE